MNTRIYSAAAVLLAATISVTALAEAPASDNVPGREGPRNMIQRLDADGDGRITLEEIRAPLEQRFAELDANGDGVIDLEEFSARAMERFAARDADGNGVLEGDELPARGERHHRHRYHREP